MQKKVSWLLKGTDGQSGGYALLSVALTSKKINITA
jgi:hypothetical protein